MRCFSPCVNNTVMYLLSSIIISFISFYIVLGTKVFFLMWEYTFDAAFNIWSLQLDSVLVCFETVFRIICFLSLIWRGSLVALVFFRSSMCLYMMPYWKRVCVERLRSPSVSSLSRIRTCWVWTLRPTPLSSEKSFRWVSSSYIIYNTILKGYFTQ